MVGDERDHGWPANLGERSNDRAQPSRRLCSGKPPDPSHSLDQHPVYFGTLIGGYAFVGTFGLFILIW
jgi:hypothetical protein